MTRDALIRELRKAAKAQGLTLSVVPNRGKGSHYRVSYGTNTITIKSGELTPAYVRLVKRQLNVE